MKLFLSSTIILIISLSIPSLAFSLHTNFALPDSVPPPPPDTPDSLTGPIENCLGDTAVYNVDFPLGCSAEWYINGSLQGSDSSSLQIIWTDVGSYTISLYFDCGSGAIFADSLVIDVYDQPLKPGNIFGDSAVCEFTTHTYSTTVGTNESCEWYVAGEQQASADTFMVYSFGETGDYLIEVWAVSDCGISNQSSFKMVEAAGLAPDPPSPIVGPEESCVGFTETYTTEIGLNEVCQWRVDNILQETTETELEVNWTMDGEHEIEVRAVTDCGSSNPTTLQVLVFETPLVNLGNDTTIIEGQSLFLDAGNPGSQYLWSTGETTQSIVVTVSDNYSVVVTNFCGEDTDSIFVDVIVGIQQSNEAHKLIISNNNNSLFIDTPGQEIKEMLIINLTGKVIYKGKSNQQVFLPGRGVYILKVKTDKAMFTRKVLIFTN